MSRLDSHVLAVQNRLTLDILLRAMGWTTLAYAGAATIVALVHKLFKWTPAGGLVVWAIGGAALALVAAMLWAIIKRPGGHEAAVAIDQKLALKEKFSTALYARHMKDEFAQAAVRDAEQTAQNVSLYKRFPLTMPRTMGGTVLLACVTLAVLWLVPPIQWSSASVTVNKPKAVDPIQQAEAKKIIEDALVKVEAQAKIAPEDPNLKAIMADLKEMLKNPPKETQSARTNAMRALQESAEAMNRKLTHDRMAAMAKENDKLFKALGLAPQDKGKVSDFQRDLAKNDFDKAQKDLDELAKSVEKMSKEEQEKAGAAMKELADKLQQLANNPQAKQDLENKLQKAGMNKDQAKEMADAIQQAAQNPQQAQQQLQNLQQQLQQQQAAAQQQIAQQIQQLQAQAQAGNPQAQQQIQQLQQAAQQMQQMQQAMQQAMQQGQGQCQGQQAAQQMAQAAQQMAQAMQQGNGQGAQQAAQQMQQQLAQLGQNADQAQNLQDAANAAKQAADAAAGQCNNPGQGEGQKGEWNQGQQNQAKGGGEGGVGGIQDKEFAPFTTKEEKSPSQDQENGKILASQLVKASALKGESKEQMKAVVAAGQQEKPDEVEQDRVPRNSMKAVKDYFKSMEPDTK